MKKKVGRPSKYNPEYPEKVYKLCLLGATDKETADFFDVDEATVNRWKIDYPEFCESIKRGKIDADAKVAESLFKRALGYEYQEVHYEKVDLKSNIDLLADDEITEDIYKKKIVTKILPGDVAAQNIWLKNRRGRVKPEDGQKWADKQEIGVTDNAGNDVVIFKLPDNGRG